MIGIILFLSLFLSGEGLFEEAGRAYKNGDFDKAYDLYGEMLAAGAGDSALYYNLGNACWRLGRMGEARYCWEKSMQIDPSDPDARYNLDIIRKILEEKDSGTFMEVLLEKLRTISSFNSFFIFVLFWVWFFFVSFLIYYARRKEKFFWLGLGSLFFAVFFGIFLVLRYEREIRRREGVVMARSEIFNSPGNLQPQGSINEGRKVEIIGEEGGWVLIGIREKNLRVWIKEEEIREL